MYLLVMALFEGTTFETMRKLYTIGGLPPTVGLGVVTAALTVAMLWLLGNYSYKLCVFVVAAALSGYAGLVASNKISQDDAVMLAPMLATIVLVLLAYHFSFGESTVVTAVAMGIFAAGCIASQVISTKIGVPPNLVVAASAAIVLVLMYTGYRNGGHVETVERVRHRGRRYEDGGSLPAEYGSMPNEPGLPDDEHDDREGEIHSGDEWTPGNWGERNDPPPEEADSRRAQGRLVAKRGELKEVAAELRKRRGRGSVEDAEEADKED